MTLTAYYSHSWEPADATLNLQIADRLWDTCDLLLDAANSRTPPWYVNRIENHIRRADVFVGVLPGRPVPGDKDKNISQYSIFEVRMAERARKPRLVLYEDFCGFRTPHIGSDGLICYLAFEPVWMTDRRRQTTLTRIDHWLSEVNKKIVPSGYLPNNLALVLASSKHQDSLNRIVAALKSAKYPQVEILTRDVTDVELDARMRAASLIVADIADRSLWDVYGMAHTLCIPTIRLIRGEDAGELAPSVVRGWPAHPTASDLVVWDNDDSMYEAVYERAIAMRDTQQALGREDGKRVLARRAIEGRKVFISHNLDDADRATIDQLYDFLKSNGVSCFEYVEDNEPGEDWQQRLTKELVETGLAVVVYSDGFESSRICMMELDSFQSRGVPILPFLVGGRREPYFKLEKMHHSKLELADPCAAARRIYERTIAELSQANAD